MLVSFLKGRSGLQAPTDFRNLLGPECPWRKLFERAEGNAVSLAQGSIDGAGFGHAHLGVVENQGRNVTRMGVTESNKAAALGRFIDCGLEDPEVFLGAAECKNGFGLNSCTLLFHRDSQ
jgi:hypothetical protein